jgi:thioredoxin reductase (NADPH)
METKDVIIVGGGPAGLTSGLYLRRAGLQAILLEKLLCGGTPLNTERIENYPGFPEPVSGRELMERMRRQAEGSGLEINELKEVVRVSKEGGAFLVETGAGTWKALSVIVATGTVPKRLGIKGEAELIGMGVSFCATCDGPFFRGKEVAVVGGGDAALEEALYLSRIARKVYVIHRRERFRAQKVLEERARWMENIEFLLERLPLEIEGKGSVEAIVVEEKGSGRIEKIPVDGVFVYVGSKPDIGFLDGLVDTDEEGFIITDEALSTKTHGLFAAGDVRKKVLRQISTAVADGAIAAFAAQRYISGLRG